MSAYKPPLVIIAPKGEEYSSIDDETFALYQSRPAFLELTLEQYSAWVITADTILCNSKRVITRPASPTTQFDWDVDATGQRLISIEGESEQVVDFSGMAPGWFDASKNGVVWFRVSDEDQEAAQNSGSAFIIQQTYILDNILALTIKPFYHRDKFYLVWDDDPRPPPAGTSYYFDIEPTRLYFKYITITGVNSTTVEYEFNLSV
jgi:hypothetical protein